ncbi:glucan endo-1,3-beta-D-glucosidase-like [Lycium ferocissimum]|uniref:glucan endo-1,3-beta-D-glucosidase-like n=1 Tax=Lycium ferocissimum TaxID=112874 RepID=UPI0028158334|nr:glucan endo-1,3-beta-D-glucosidase-like [Lycium ferocissimum]
MTMKGISNLFYILVLQKTWCVAKPSSDEKTLKENINYACSQVDCRILQKGCTCSLPDNLMNHASIAMNLYYQAKGRNHWNCHFGNSALVVCTDPSYGSCIYE